MTEEIEGRNYSQLSISSVQFCSSSGYLLRSIIQAAVVVILEIQATVICWVHSLVGEFQSENWTLTMNSMS